MLLAEQGLPLLLEELERMPAADRRAILSRLSAPERERVARLAVEKPGAATGPTYSADIEARIAALRSGDTAAVTGATAEALRRLLDIVPVMAAPAVKPQVGASLVDSLGGLFRRRGSP